MVWRREGVSVGDKIGLLLDLDGGTLEVHHNGDNLGAIHAPLAWDLTCFGVPMGSPHLDKTGNACHQAWTQLGSDSLSLTSPLDRLAEAVCSAQG